MPSLAALIETSRSRRPSATIMLGSPTRGISARKVQIPNRAGAITLAQQFGQPISGGQVTIVNPPFVPRLKDTISIAWGYNGQELPAFTGFITSVNENSYPAEITVQIQDLLWLADFAAPSESEINLANNKTARDVLIILLRDWAGIPASRIAIPEIEHSPGVPWTLGQLTPIAWRGASPLAAAQQICSPLSLWLFADAGGIVRIVPISGAPTEQAYRTLQDGQHLLINGAPRRESAAASIYTRVVVTGAATGVQGVQLKDAWQTDSALLPPGKHRELSYSNALLEFLNEADAGAASVTAVARRMLAEHSRTPEIVKLRIKADPRAYVGRTIALQTGRLRYDSPKPFFIYAIQASFGAGQFDMQLTLDGGIGEGGYTLIPPPLAAFSYFLHEETLTIGHVREVFTDAATSKSLGGGEIAAYSWTDNSTPPQTGTGQRCTFIYPETQASATITLEVTDTNGKTASVSTTIQLTGDNAGQPSQRVLSVAAGNAWYVTPDSGATWRKATGQAAIAVPPISAGGSAEATPAEAEAVGLLTTGSGSGQAIRQTLDKLATAPTTLAALPGPARFLWQNERHALRVWAAIGEHVYLSTDGAQSFTQRGSPASGQLVNWIVESFSAEGVIDVLAGPHAYVSFDAGATYSTALEGPEPTAIARNLASGFDRHWVGFSNVTAPASPLRSYEGDIAAFPPDLDPPVTSIQALTMLVEAPTLYAIDQAGRIWRLSAEDGGSAEIAATMPEITPGTRDTAQHMIRTPDERIIYICGNAGVYKLFYDTGRIEQLLAFGVGEQGHMIGYAELAQRPQAAGLLIGTTASASQKGIYHFDSTSWRLTNNGLPPGRSWTATAGSTRSSNHWLAWGHTPAGTGVSGSVGSAGGHMVDKGDGLSPLYQTINAGALWTPIELPAPYLYIDQASKVSMATPRLAYDDTGAIVVFGAVNGIGNFFGAADPGLALWRGQPGAIDVLSAYDNNGSVATPIGDTTGVAAYDLAAGIDGAALLSANFGTRPGHPGAEVARISADGTSVTYISSADLQFKIDRRPGTNSAVAISGSAVYATLDYETLDLSLRGTLAPSTEPQTAIAAASDGIYYGRNNSGGAGIWRISDPITSPQASQVGAAGRQISQLAAAQQTTRPTLAAREKYDESAAAAPALFWLGSGSAWRSIPGPDGVTNAELSSDERGLAALAIPITTPGQSS